MDLYYVSWKDDKVGYIESPTLHNRASAEDLAVRLGRRGFDYIRIRPYVPLIGEKEDERHLYYFPYGQ